MTKHRNSNSRQKPPGRTPGNNGDPKFKTTVKLLYRIIQVLHHLSVMTVQQKGKLTKGFDSKFRELNRFLKPACPSDKLAADISAANMGWIKSVTGVLISHYEGAVAKFSEQLKSCDLIDSKFKEAQDLATTWARKNFRKKLNESTLTEFRKICIGSRMTQEDMACAQSSSGNKRAPNSVSKLPVPDPGKSPAKRAEIAPQKQSQSAPAARKPVSHSPGQSQRKLFKPWRSEKGAKWTFPELSAPTLIIGDSNLSNISKSRRNSKDLEICSYPGAKFYSFTKFLKETAKTFGHVKNLVLNIGINERDNHPTATSLPNIKKLLSAAKSVFPEAKISLASLQWDPKRITSSQDANLKLLQEGFSGLKQVHLIPTLAQSKFEIQRLDQYGVHWTMETGNDLLDHWIQHLN